MRTTFPNDRSTPFDLTRSCSRGGGCGGVSAYHVPSKASRMRGIFKTDDISACIAVIFACEGGEICDARAYSIGKRNRDWDEEGEQKAWYFIRVCSGDGERRGPPWWDDVR